MSVIADDFDWPLRQTVIATFATPYSVEIQRDIIYKANPYLNCGKIKKLLLCFY